jgi:hypothetical protein
LVMSAAALMAAMVAVTAVPAFATIHPLIPGAGKTLTAEPAGLPEGETPSESQDPPGLSGQSNTDNIAQPVLSVATPDVCIPEGACGTNPSGGNSLNAFQDPVQ